MAEPKVALGSRFRYTVMAGEYPLGHAASRRRALDLAVAMRVRGEHPDRLILRRRSYPFETLRERRLGKSL